MAKSYRTKGRILGTSQRPRLHVFRTPKHIYAQLIDDEKGKTLLSLSDIKMKIKKGEGKTAVAYEVGKAFAAKVLEKKIEKVVFDRGGRKYHGRVKAVAEGAREGGLKF